MKRATYKKIYLLLLIALVMGILSLNASAQFRVIGYLPTWGNLATAAAAVDYTKVTHINLAFINPTNDAGDLEVPAGLATAVTLAHDNNVKILISLAGANINTARWASLQNSTNRAAFVAKIAQYVTDHNIDGVDVDLEGGNIGANYESFVSDLYTALNPNGKLLTAAVAQWNGGSITNTALSKFDFINLMAYDVTGTWAPTNPGQHSPYSKATTDLNYWGNTRGVPAAKMTLGVPFYGYNFNTNNNTAGSMTYKSIVNAYPGTENQDSYTIATGHTVYYNGIPTIQDKTTLALNQAGGIMIWELTQDFAATDSKSLLKAIADVIQASINNTAPTVSITSPANSATFTEDQTITVTADAADPDVTGSISKVLFYAGTLKIGEDNTAPYSIDWAGAGSGTYNLTAKAFDNSFGVTTSAIIAITVGPGTEAPLGGTVRSIPGKIEAEDFNVGGNTVSYYDNTSTNLGGAYRTGSVDVEACSDVGGGYDVGWTVAGEWLQYHVNVTTDGAYDFKVRVASNTVAAKKFHIEMDGVNVTGDITVNSTGGWQTWQTKTVSNVALTAGDKTMRIVFTNGDFNLNYVEVSAHVLGTSDPVFSFTNYKIQPNPFTDNATISFSLKNSGDTKIIIYDEMGREMSVVADKYLNAGTHDIGFNSSSLKKGFYICQIIQNGEVKALKLIKE